MTDMARIDWDTTRHEFAIEFNGTLIARVKSVVVKSARIEDGHILAHLGDVHIIDGGPRTHSPADTEVARLAALDAQEFGDPVILDSPHYPVVQWAKWVYGLKNGWEQCPDIWALDPVYSDDGDDDDL